MNEKDQSKVYNPSLNKYNISLKVYFCFIFVYVTVLLDHSVTASIIVTNLV